MLKHPKPSLTEKQVPLMRSWSDLGLWRWITWLEMLTALPTLLLRPFWGLGTQPDQHNFSTCWAVPDFPLCLKSIVVAWIGTFAESFPKVKGKRSSGQFQTFELKQTKQPTNMTIIFWKLKIHSPVFILKGFGFGALRKQVFFKMSIQNEIICFCQILVGTFLYCPAWPSSYWSIWILFVGFVCFTEKFTLCCVLCGLKTSITFITARIFSKAFLKKIDVRYKNIGA